MKRQVLFIGMLFSCLLIRAGWAEQSDISEARATVERILTQNILPFWYPEVLDTEGGYRLNHDIEGKWRGYSEKALVTQARTVWFFSRLVRAGYGNEDHLQAAAHGYRYLRDTMWDDEHGGFYWAVDANGKPTRENKHLYGQSFGLYALSEFGRTAQNQEALQLARDLYTLLEHKAYDMQNGGYFESFSQDWTIPAGGTNYMGVAHDIKLMNTHLHLMEALTSYYRATADPTARERLLELVRIQSNTVVRKTKGACTDKYTLDWLPLHGPEYDRISYGHDIENVWLLIDACDALGISTGPFLDLFQTLMETSLKYGFDHEKGGFYDTGDFNTPADSKAKIFWVEAEGLVSCLEMYHLTEEERYLEAFLKTLDWVNHYQADWENGDWFSSIDEEGNAAGGKASAWKSPYHNGRAMIRCIETIDKRLK